MGYRPVQHVNKKSQNTLVDGYNVFHSGKTNYVFASLHSQVILSIQLKRVSVCTRATLVFRLFSPAHNTEIILNKKERRVMMKPLLMKLLIMFMTAVLIMSTYLTVFAASDIETKLVETDFRIENYVVEKLRLSGNDLTVSQVKTLTDFNGKIYKLVECSPSGYFIILPESGVTIEYSFSAPSPYEGLDNNLYYAGPTFYYTTARDNTDANTIDSKEDAAYYVHTVLPNEEIRTDEIENVQQKCAELYEEYNSMTVASAKDYFSGEISCDEMKGALASTALTSVARVASTAALPDASWFQNLASGFGYTEGPNSEGCCGYVAANLILKYWHSKGTITLPSLHRTINSSNLTNALIAEGLANGGSYDTIGATLTTALSSYLENYNVDGAASYALLAYNLYNELDNGRPTVLLGDLYDPRNGNANDVLHAVVAYSYFWGADGYLTFTCHYGWQNWQEVNISSANCVFGSQTRFDPYE